MTAGQRWRRRRNLAIADLATSGHGWSQRLLADVFDLPRSRIASILAEMRALATARKEIASESGADRPGPCVRRIRPQGSAHRVG